MTLANPKPSGWAAFDQIQHAQMNLLGTQIVFALDGNAGGTYAPSAQLILAGAFALRLNSGLDVHGDAGVTGSLTVETNLLVDGDAAIGGASGFVGLATFSGSAAFDGLTGFNDIATFSAPVNIDDALSCTAGANVTGGLGCDTLTATSEVILTGKGIRENVEHAPNADHTFALGDATIISVDGGTVTATRVYTINNGTSEGQQIDLLNWTANTMTIHNQAGGSIGPGVLNAIDGGNIPGRMRLLWINNGSGSLWWPVETH